MITRYLFVDELRGFMRSKVMVALWIGLPVLSLFVALLQPETEGVPILSFMAILVGSIGGTLSAVLVSTGITSERSRHVYDLFLVRPVRRGQLLVAKFFAAFLCLLFAAILSLAVGALVDVVAGRMSAELLVLVGESLLVSLATMAIATGVGLLFGVLIGSVAVSAILSVYLGNQLSALIVLPTLMVETIPVVPFTLGVGIAVPALLVIGAILIFRRKSL
jgi:ABC-2 type transport system permease protein